VLGVRASGANVDREVRPERHFDRFQAQGEVGPSG